MVLALAGDSTMTRGLGMTVSLLEEKEGPDRRVPHRGAHRTPWAIRKRRAPSRVHSRGRRGYDPILHGVVWSSVPSATWPAASSVPCCPSDRPNRMSAGPRTTFCRESRLYGGGCRARIAGMRSAWPAGPSTTCPWPVGPGRMAGTGRYRTASQWARSQWAGSQWAGSQRPGSQRRREASGPGGSGRRPPARRRQGRGRPRYVGAGRGHLCGHGVRAGAAGDLVRRRPPGLRSRRRGRTWRRRIGLYLRHDGVGAELLDRAGSDPLTVAWAGEHHRPPERWSVDAPDRGRPQACRRRLTGPSGTITVSSWLEAAPRVGRTPGGRGRAAEPARGPAEEPRATVLL